MCGDKKKYYILLVLLFLFFDVFAYRLKDEDVIVSGGIITYCSYNISTKGNIIEIPETLDGQTVTGIGDNAFNVAGKIAELKLPSTLVTIGNYAFDGHALTTLDIPSGVKSIGSSAFSGNALASINLPEGLETIGARAFEDNLLTSLTLPDGILSVGYRAFRNNNIVSVNIPNSLVTIAGNAFANNQIASLSLPNSIVAIESYAFANNKITSLTIPNSVETIGYSAFTNNKIATLDFESGCQLIEISEECFSNNNIKILTLPNSILQINRYAFQNNQNLSSVTFGTNLLRIKRGAFYRCNLSSLNLPSSLIFIGKYAFLSNQLTTIKLPTSSNDYLWNDINGNTHNEGDNVNDFYSSYVAIIPYTLALEDVVVENGIIVNCTFFDEITNVASVINIPENIDGQDIVGIGGNVFYDNGISEINLPDGIQNIGEAAFQSNEIVNLTIPNSLIEIGDRAFNNNGLNSITFEPTSQLEIIGRDAFSYNQLTSIDFPQSVTIIKKTAFAYNWLRNIAFEENSKLVSLGVDAFLGNNDMPSFTLPDPTVNGFNDYWVDWDNIEYRNNLFVTNYETFYKIPIEYILKDDDVEVVDGVIVSYTPSNPYANIITIPEILDGQEIIGIGQSVFTGLGLIGVNLPSTLKIIKYSAFEQNDLLEITIPGSVEEIQDNAFYQNILSQLTFEANSQLRNIGAHVFYGNKITTITFPDSVQSIGSYAFGYNQISSGIAIPDSIEYIGMGAFTGNQIPSVFFTGNSQLLYMGESAFAYNKISNEVFIPLELTEIPSYAFLNNKISKVITHDGIVEYGFGAFLYNNSDLKIVLHEPPTIPLVTYFFWWKDNYGNHYDPREMDYEISSSSGMLNFNNRYKAVIDQFFVVKFVVTDDNNDPIEGASIDFFYKTLSTDVNGIDSIGPVLRGIQEYIVSGVDGCLDFTGSVDVQDNMTVPVVLTRYYNVDLNVVDINNNPIPNAGLYINDDNSTFDSNGKISFKLPDGEYPFTISSSGYKEVDSTLFVLDADTSLTIVLDPVFINNLPNGGEGVAFTDTTYGSTYTTNNNPFTRSSYTFSHWNTEADGTGISYNEKQLINLGFTDIDLYATWTPVDYNIVYHLNGGTNNPGNPSKYNIESEINFLPADKTSLYFATWIDADSNRVSRIEKGSTGDMELWAVFTTEPTYFIDYHNIENATHDNPSSYTKFDLPFLFTNAEKRGYEFTGWYEDDSFTKQILNIPDGSTSNYDVYAKWSNAIEYEISYELYGGSNNVNNPTSYTIESDDIIFATPSKIGAKFISWYSDINLTDKITEIQKGSVGDTTIYAKWDLDTFNIQYVLNGGNNNAANPDEYTIESNTINFENPERIGYFFEGWFSDINMQKEISQIPHGSYGDTTIYAKWALDTYEIQYVLDGGINNENNPANYTIESNDILFESPTKIGAKFISWYSDEGFTNEIVEIPQGSYGDTTIYAKWVLDTFNIQYVLNGGINNIANPYEYTIESSTIVLEHPERDGFIFDGWFTDSEFTNQIHAVENGSYGDITIYAKWLELFDVHFIITTDGETPAKDVDIVINNSKTLISDLFGLADTIMPDGTELEYSVEINGIVIEVGSETITSDVTIKIEIVDCYIRWYDVLFCDNGDGLWTNFEWYKDDAMISGEQFYHQPGGVEAGSYKLMVTSVAGTQYIWEKESNSITYSDNNNPSEILDVQLYPNPVSRNSTTHFEITGNIDLQPFKIFIYNANGSLILPIKEVVNMNEISIDDRFSSGLYYIVLFDYDNHHIVKELIVD